MSHTEQQQFLAETPIAAPTASLLPVHIVLLPESAYLPSLRNPAIYECQQKTSSNNPTINHLDLGQYTFGQSSHPEASPTKLQIAPTPLLISCYSTRLTDCIYLDFIRLATELYLTEIGPTSNIDLTSCHAFLLRIRVGYLPIHCGRQLQYRFKNHVTLKSLHDQAKCQQEIS